MSKKRYYKEYEDGNDYEENDKDQLGTVFIITNKGESPALDVSIVYGDGVTLMTPFLNTNEDRHHFIVNPGTFVMVEYRSKYRKKEYTQILDFVYNTSQKKFPYFRRKKFLYNKYKKEEERRGFNRSTSANTKND
ncbi:hypothetical protein F4212_16000 [Candidatus Poribacteria bacterium]|nr:hypothetical protein [Candidatus Poribacteria bacterium]